MLHVLSCLGTICLSITTSRHPEHAVPSHHYHHHHHHRHWTVSHPNTANKHSSRTGHALAPQALSAAQDVFAPILCILYESGVVRSLHIGSACNVRVWPKSCCSHTELRPSEKRRCRFDKNNELVVLNTLGVGLLESVIVLHAVIKNSHSPLLTSNI